MSHSGASSQMTWAYLDTCALIDIATALDGGVEPA